MGFVLIKQWRMACKSKEIVRTMRKLGLAHGDRVCLGRAVTGLDTAARRRPGVAPCAGQGDPGPTRICEQRPLAVASPDRARAGKLGRRLIQLLEQFGYAALELGRPSIKDFGSFDDDVGINAWPLRPTTLRVVGEFRYVDVTAVH